MSESGIFNRADVERAAHAGADAVLVGEALMRAEDVSGMVRDLASVGSVLDAAVQDGANTLNGLTFGIADDKDEQDGAKKAAVADAQAQAKLLAEAAGVNLGPIVSISEGMGYQPPVPMAAFKADAMAVPVVAGEIGVQAQVTITWELAQ